MTVSRRCLNRLERESRGKNETMRTLSGLLPLPLRRTSMRCTAGPDCSTRLQRNQRNRRSHYLAVALKVDKTRRKSPSETILFLFPSSKLADTYWALTKYSQITTSTSTQRGLPVLVCYRDSVHPRTATHLQANDLARWFHFEGLRGASSTGSYRLLAPVRPEEFESIEGQTTVDLFGQTTPGSIVRLQL